MKKKKTLEKFGMHWDRLYQGKQGKQYTEPKSIANALNEHFATIGPKIAAKIPSKSKMDHIAASECNDKKDNIDECKFHLEPVSEEYHLKQLQSLSESKATGTDEIPSKLLKIACSSIVAPITHIINRSI